MGKGKAKDGDVHAGYGDKKGGKKSTASSTVRKVWFSNGLSHAGALMQEADFAGAPFALAVEYVPPHKGRYGAKLVIVVKDTSVVALIDRHKLRGASVYVDRRAVALDDSKVALDRELNAEMGKDSLDFVWSQRWAWLAARKLSVWVQEHSAVRITFGTLLDGIEIRGTMEECRSIIREVTMSVDKLASNLDTGAAFDSGDTRVFAPGTRKKTAEDVKGIPPSEWDR